MATVPLLTRVLVTCAEQPGVLAAVRALRAHGYEPWVVGGSRVSLAGLSRAAGGFVKVPDPRSNPARFARAVADVAARIRAAAVLPGTERALSALTHFAALFAPPTRAGVPTLAALELVTAKPRIAGLAARAGLAVPGSQVVESGNSETWAGGFPAVVKPLRSESWERTRFVQATARIVGSAGQLEDVAASLPGRSVIVERFARGPVESVAGVAWDGDLLAPVQFVASRLWPPDAGIVAHATAVPLDARLVESVAELVRLTGFEGMLQVQLIKDGDRRFLIDINPRIYASLALALACGRNLPGIWVDLLLGREVTVPPYVPGASFRSEPGDARHLVMSLREHEWRKAASILRSRRGTTHAVFSRTDPLPLVAAAAAALPRRAPSRRRGRPGPPSSGVEPGPGPAVAPPHSSGVAGGPADSGRAVRGISVRHVETLAD